MNQRKSFKVYFALCLSFTLMQVTWALAAEIRFAAIGDYGNGSKEETEVAKLVKSWHPDFIITLGDNNYPTGEATTIDRNIGRDYHEFIYQYKGNFGNGSPEQRFFPSLGNHDWDCFGCIKSPNAYLTFFGFDKKQTYYDFVKGPIHFYALDSDKREPNGHTEDSDQARWLKEKLSKSTSKFNVVFFHHPPYCSGGHGSSKKMRWPFKEWGASAVLAGHSHLYERLIIEDMPYFVNGLGGADIYPVDITNPVTGSKIQFNKAYGAMLITADDKTATFEFYTSSGEKIDRYVLSAKQMGTEKSKIDLKK